MKSRFRILGRTGLLVGDQFDDRWGPRKLRGILAVLLLHPRRPMPIDALIDWVWPEGKGPREQGTFYTYANRIREALGEMAAPPKIVADGGTYRIEIDREEVDFFEFRAMAERARGLVREGDHEAAAGVAVSAVDLWKDLPLADPEGERAKNWRRWAQAEHLIPAHETMLEALSALGRHDEVLHRLADLPVDYQSNLTLIKRRLETLYALNRYKEATTYFLGMRKLLTAEFDQDEADELLRFHQELQDRNRAPHAAPSGVAAETEGATHAPHLLPHDVTDFTGRENLLSQLDAMATTTTGDLAAGVVVLTGPPGVGKTALAVHWAHRVTDRFPGGRLYADLAGFAGGAKVDAAEVVTGFLAALGFPVERIPSSASRAMKLRSLLTGRRVLAVLDNVASSRDVLPLLDCLSSCLVVITSRRRLTGLIQRGALGLAVQPLDYDEARKWLSHRVGDRAANEPGAMAELTALCGGSPLALRGVAEHVTIRPGVRLDEFVEELRDAHALLGLGDDGDSLDGSVRTVFSWSYQALAPDERRLFRLLGLHPGPDIDLDAAAALAGRDNIATKRALDALVNSHLLTQPVSRLRYRLHDLLRKYAAECIEAEGRAERSSAEIRLLSYYLHTANNADMAVFPYRPRDELPPLAEGVTPRDFADDEAAMTWCIQERANLNSVIHYAVRHGMHEYVMKLTNASGEILQRVGYHDDALDSLGMALQSAREIGDVEGEGDFLGNLGFVQLNLRDLSSAERYLRAAKERYDAVGFQIGGAVVTLNLARLHVEREQFGRAIRLCLDALAVLRQGEAKGVEILTLCRLGEAHRRAGDLDAAMTFCRDGLWLAEHVRDQRGQALCLAELGSIYYERGDLASAAGYCRRALSALERQRDVAHIAKTHHLLATIHRDEGDLPEAERCARQALAFSQSARNPRDIALAYQLLGSVLHEQGQRQEAANAWANAHAIFEDLADPQAATIRTQLTEITHTPPRVPATRTESLTTESQRPSRPFIP